MPWPIRWAMSQAKIDPYYTRFNSNLSYELDGNAEDGYGVLSLIREIADSSDSKILIMHTAASRVGAMDIGFVFDGDWIEAVKNSDVVYNLGADEINIEAGPFVIYQGSHGDRGAHRADLILPSASYTEEPGLFVNLEGRVQLAHRANFAPGDAKENWAILRALSSELDNKLPYDNLTELREILFKKFGHLRHIGLIEEKSFGTVSKGKLNNNNFKNIIKDFYLTNPIARASEVMAELSSVTVSKEINVAAE